MIKGVFTLRVSITRFRFRTSNSEEYYFVNVNNHLPLLNHVLYTISPQEEWAEILDGEYTHNDNEEHKKFNVEFHVQRLVPSNPVCFFQSHVESGDFNWLVRVFGGVDPLQLRRFLPDVDAETPHPLVLEAVVMQFLAAKFCELRKVWMNQEEIKYLMGDSKLAEACKRLIASGVIERRKTATADCIAFSWASEKLRQCEGCVVQHSELEKMRKAERGQHLKVDMRLSISRFIATHQLPAVCSSILDSKCFPFPPIEIENFSWIAQLKKRIEQEKHTERGRIVCISETGNVSCGDMVCLVRNSRIPQLEKNSTILVGECLSNPKNVVVHSGKHLHQANVMRAELVYSSCIPIGMLAYSQLDLLKHMPVDADLVVVINPQTNMHFIPDIQKSFACPFLYVSIPHSKLVNMH